MITISRMKAQRIIRVCRVVADRARAADFYRSALGFRNAVHAPNPVRLLDALAREGARATETMLALGAEELALVEFADPGRPYPASRRSNDRWFQHLAIVVSDMDTAYGHLRAHRGWQPISRNAPQTLPVSNGRVRAFKFRDPDGHPLELLWFPPGNGHHNWEQVAARSSSPFLGIDHTALCITSTRRSVAFYGSLGLRVTGRSINRGEAQSKLDDIDHAHVRVIGLRPAASSGPGLELLAYRPPGSMRGSSGLRDIASDWIVFGVAAEGGRALRAADRLATDPDGHRLLLVEEPSAPTGLPAAAPLT
jgi:catechol 2,3-dioxygenase-like lactoylglutathione lyase family enzyme